VFGEHRRYATGLDETPFLGCNEAAVDAGEFLLRRVIYAVVQGCVYLKGDPGKFFPRPMVRSCPWLLAWPPLR
jgi:hypothetical protein